MTTLTQNTSLQPDHCPHKLPTSCRLTARPTCCACQDNRPQAGRYMKYIDGVGYVMLGTRQDGYCWPCKVFWDARITAARIQPEQARVPFIPDQTEFVNTWHDWHRGYRVIALEDGSEEIQQLIGQPLNEVLIGHLPIPVDGMDSSDGRAVRWIETEPIPASLAAPPQEVLLISDEDHLFDSSDDDNNEEHDIESTVAPSSQLVNETINDGAATSAQNQPPAPVSVLTAASARELRSVLRRLDNLCSSIASTSHRMQHFLNENPLLGEDDLARDVIDLKTAVDQIIQRTRTLVRHDTIYAALQANSGREENQERSVTNNAQVNNSAPLAAPALQQEQPAQEESSLDQPRIRRQQRHAAIAARMATVFGTREDVQQSNYESPLNLMFRRAQAYGERMRRERVEREANAREYREVLSSLTAQIGAIDDDANQAVGVANTSQQADTQITTNENHGDLQPNSSYMFGADRDLTGGIRVANDGIITHFFTRLSPPTHDLGDDLENLLESLRDIVLSLLRARMPRLERQSHLDYERLLWFALSRFSQDASDALIRDESNPQRQRHLADDLSNGIERLLEHIYIRDDNQSLWAFYNSILIQELRSRNPERRGIPGTSVSPIQDQEPSASQQEASHQSTSTPQPSTHENGRPGTESTQPAEPSSIPELINQTFQNIETAAEVNTRSSLPFTSHNSRNRSTYLVPVPPQPLELSEMTIRLQCTVCQEQIADIALVPCGHLIMCRWCSDRHAEIDTEHEGARVGSTCPVCRAKIKQRLRIWGLESGGKSSSRQLETARKSQNL